jgi:DNA polymerase III delta subunit
MIIYLYGPDSYRRQQKLKEIIADYKKKHSAFAMERLDLEKVEDWDKLKDFVKARSLFDELKLGIVENYRELEDGQLKEFAVLLKENLNAKEPILILLDDKAPNKDFKFLLEGPVSTKASAGKTVLSQEFEIYTGQKFTAFAQMEAKKRGINLDRESQELLARFYEGNTWGLITELDKLALLNEKQITKEILEKHVEVSLPVNIFSLLGQIVNTERISVRLSILEELFFRSQDPGMIFNLYSSFIRNPEDKIKMADYDVAVKSGKLEYEEVLTDLVITN